MNGNQMNATCRRAHKKKLIPRITAVMFSFGLNLKDIASITDIKYNSLRKAMSDSAFISANKLEDVCSSLEEHVKANYAGCSSYKQYQIMRYSLLNDAELLEEY